MAGYRFVKSHQLRSLLNDAEVKQKKDIHDYSGGHLNETLLLQHYHASNRKPWESATVSESLVQRSQIISESPRTERPKMDQALFEFSLGTSGVIPQGTKKPNRQSPLKKYKSMKEKEKKRKENGETEESMESPSGESMYSQLDDGILIEELPPAELMMRKNRDRFRLKEVETPAGPSAIPPLKTEPSMLHAEDTMFTTQTSFLTHQPRHLLSDLPFNYNFVTTHNLGVTRQDRFRKMRAFENSVLKKKEASEMQVLSGVKAVEHHERKLKEELEMLNLQGLGISFHKLQVYSNSLEDLINESPTFQYILRCIKAEYDNYIAWLLDHQTSQQHLLREQVEQMAMRGTSRPEEMASAVQTLTSLEDETQASLTLNQSMRDELVQEKEWLENTPEPALESRDRPSLMQRDIPLELAEEIENMKAIILEKMDAVTDIRNQMRSEFVPMTVCTHLEQCIKETEVEVQKLLKQNEYFERSIDEMETELKEAIQDADTSEKDARRIWRKVNSKRGLPGNPAAAKGDSEDDDEEEESKWNWYIS